MRAAVAFLTVFGTGRRPVRTTIRWFPVVGAGLGAMLGALWWGATLLWPFGLVPAALTVTADLACTGMLHLDGLADSADGLLPHLERARRLEVMTQPDTGAFALGVSAMVLVVRVAALASLRPEIALLSGIWCASRSLMVLITVVVPYAHPGGLATGFLGDSRGPVVIAGAGGVVAGGVLCAAARGLTGVGAVVALVCAGATVTALAWSRLGGFTGDVIGAAAMVGETAALVVAAARW